MDYAICKPVLRYKRAFFPSKFQRLTTYTTSDELYMFVFSHIEKPFVQTALQAQWRKQGWDNGKGVV